MSLEKVKLFINTQKKKEKLQLQLITLLFLIAYIYSFQYEYFNDLNFLKMCSKDFNKNVVRPKVLIISCANPGDFDPSFGLANELYKQGAQVDYMINEICGLHHHESTIDKLEKIKANILPIRPFDAMDSRTFDLLIYSAIEILLTIKE